MLHPEELTVGSLVITNKGDVIKVESISTKRQHRKVGYHTPNDPYRIKYVRLAQCSGIALTNEFFEKNGFARRDYEFPHTLPHVFDIRTKDGCHVRVFDKVNYHTIIIWGTFVNRNRNYYKGCVNTVHDFQSKLRSNGLYDLANNLKV